MGGFDDAGGVGGKYRSVHVGMKEETRVWWLWVMGVGDLCWMMWIVWWLWWQENPEPPFMGHILPSLPGSATQVITSLPMNVLIPLGLLLPPLYSLYCYATLSFPLWVCRRRATQLGRRVIWVRVLGVLLGWMALGVMWMGWRKQGYIVTVTPDPKPLSRIHQQYTFLGGNKAGVKAK